MIATMRMVLASSALLVIFFIPSEPDREITLTYSALVLYTVYSVALYVLDVRGARILRHIQDRGHWIDVACYTLLITLSSGTNSIFFFGYFFPILVASFRWGFASGLRVVAVSTVLFTTLGYITAPPEPEFESQRFMIRPIYLLALGYMMAYWGGSEVQVKRRLAFLNQMGAVSNPRFGVDRTLGVMMHRLMSFFEAQGCSIVTTDPISGVSSLRCASARNPEDVARAELIPAPVVQLLLGPSPDHAVIYCAGTTKGWYRARAVCRLFSASADQGSQGKYGGNRKPGPNEPSQREPDLTVEKDPASWVEEKTSSVRTCEAIAAALDVSSFMTVPLNFRNRMSGRLYLTVGDRRIFDESEVRFLQQAIDHVLPLVDNIRLVNQLASAAAGEERRKIARDIHDSIIQPYIGLQIGLAGVRQKLDASDSELSGQVERLMEMTSLGIQDLRRQVSALKGDGEQEENLLGSVWRFASKFSDVTGITVQVEAEADVRVGKRLAAEAFQMVAEGLSNIRKHTRATHVTLGLACREGCFRLRIENNGAEQPFVDFTPSSIAERAEALGGAARVQTAENGTTVVSVEVPL